MFKQYSIEGSCLRDRIAVENNAKVARVAVFFMNVALVGAVLSANRLRADKSDVHKTMMSAKYVSILIFTLISCYMRPLIIA